MPGCGRSCQPHAGRRRRRRCDCDHGQARRAPQEFGEDVSAAVSAAGARASGALLGGFSALRLGAAAVASSVTFRRAEARGAAGVAAGAEARTEAEAEADGARVDSAAQGVAGATAVWCAPAGRRRAGPCGESQCGNARVFPG